MAEVKCWTVAVGNLPMPWHSRKVKKSAKEATHYINGLNGFLGFHPCPPDGTLCIFDSENNAKRARNLMNAKGILTGTNICEVFVDEMYIQRRAEDERSN